MDPFRPLLRRLTPLWSAPWWPRLRLLLLLLHIIAVVVVACPAPVRTASKKQWDKPSVKAEIRGWQQRLGSVGIDVGEEELQQFAMTTSRRWGAARNAAVAPFSRYLRAIGAPQGWYMFTSPDREPQRFELVMTHSDGRRERVFTLGQDTPRPDLIDPGFLGEHRVRRALFQTSWSQRSMVFKEVCTWFERRLEAQVPTLKEVTCSQHQFAVEHPWNRDQKAAKTKAGPEDPVRTVRVQRAQRTSGTTQRQP